VGDALLQFYDCTLKVPIGSFKVGDLVPMITVDFEHGILQVFDKGRTSAEMVRKCRRMVVVIT
jgi:hypothetical protein